MKQVFKVLVSPVLLVAFCLTAQAQDCMQLRQQCLQQIVDDRGYPTQQCITYRLHCGRPLTREAAAQKSGPDDALEGISIYHKNCPRGPQDVFHVVRWYATRQDGGKSWRSWDGDEDESAIFIPVLYAFEFEGYNIWPYPDGTRRIRPKSDGELPPQVKDIPSLEAYIVEQAMKLNNTSGWFTPCQPGDDGARNPYARH